MSIADIQSAVNQDPFVRKTKTKYLAGLKLAIVPAKNANEISDVPLPGYEFNKFDYDIASTTKCAGLLGIKTARDQQVRLIEVRSENPKEAIGHVGKQPTNDRSSLSNGLKSNPVYNDFRYGCPYALNRHRGHQLHTAPADDFASAYHMVVAATGQCPKWAPPIPDYGNINEGISDTPTFLCGQKMQDVVDCCLGKKSGDYCAADQSRGSDKCNNFMIDWCRLHPTNPECACLVKQYQGDARVARIQKLNSEPICSDPNCFSKPNDTYRTPAIQNTKCPPVTVCAVDIGEIEFLQNTYGNAVNIYCEGAVDEKSKKQDSTTTKDDDTKQSEDDTKTKDDKTAFDFNDIVTHEWFVPASVGIGVLFVLLLVAASV